MKQLDVGTESVVKGIEKVSRRIVVVSNVMSVEHSLCAVVCFQRSVFVEGFRLTDDVSPRSIVIKVPEYTVLSVFSEALE